MSKSSNEQRAIIDIMHYGDSIYYAQLTIYDTHMTIGPATSEIAIKKMIMGHLQDIRLTAHIKQEQRLGIESIKHCLSEYKKSQGI